MSRMLNLSWRFAATTILVIGGVLVTPYLARGFEYLGNYSQTFIVVGAAQAAYQTHPLVSSIYLIFFFLVLLNLYRLGCLLRLKYDLLRRPKTRGLFYSRLIPDTPIETATSDKLGFANFISKNSASFLVPPGSPGIVFGFVDKWGFGKTSAINLLKESLLARSDKPVIIDFNPWFYTRPEIIVSAFVSTFFAAIKSSVSGSQYFALDRTQAQFERLLQLVKDSRIESMVRMFASFVEPETHETVRALRDELEGVIGKIKRPILIVIDDVDRLEPAGVIAMLMAVRLVGNIKGCSYLIAMDRSSVIDKLKNHHGQDLLEKIVQKEIALPNPGGYRVRSWAEELLETHLKANDIILENDEIRSLISDIAVELNNPRKFIRYLNDCLFFAQAHRGDFAVVDILLMSFLHTFAKPIYFRIQRSPRTYAGSFEGFRDENEMYLLRRAADEVGNERKRSERKDLEIEMELEGADPDYREIVARCLKVLFPQKYLSPNEIDRFEVPETPNRLFHINNLLGYLSYRDTEVYFLGSDVDELFFQPSKRRPILDAIVRQGRLKGFLEFIAFWVSKYPENKLTGQVPDAKELVDILVEVERHFESKKEDLVQEIAETIKLVFLLNNSETINRSILFSLSEKPENYSLTYLVLRKLLKEARAVQDGTLIPVEKFSAELLRNYRIKPVDLVAASKSWLRASTQRFTSEHVLFETEVKPIYILFGMSLFARHRWEAVQGIIQKYVSNQNGRRDAKPLLLALAKAYRGIHIPGSSGLFTRAVAKACMTALKNKDFVAQLNRVNPGFPQDITEVLEKALADTEKSRNQ